MQIPLIIIGALALAVGAVELTPATMGVGIIGAACFLAIGARIAQAGEQSHKLLAALRGEHAPGAVPMFAPGSGPAAPTVPAYPYAPSSAMAARAAAHEAVRQS
jgi:hypothetical protein